MNDTLREYVRVLRERWRRVVVTCLLVVGAAAAFLLLQQTNYQATSTVFVSTPRDDTDTYYRGDTYAQERLPSYAALIQSQELAGRVIDKLSLDTTPAVLSANTTAVPVPGTVLIQLVTLADSPADAQNINQAYLDEYIAEINSLESIPGALTPRAELLVIEPPTASDLPGGFPPTLILGAATAAGLIVGAAVAVLSALADSKIRRPEDAAEATGLPLLAVFPAYSSKRPGTEAVRMLRDSLTGALPDERRRVVLLTSPTVSTGTSSIANQLAESLRDSGASVALLDFDVRTHSRRSIDTSVVSMTDVILEMEAPEDALANVVDGVTRVPRGALPDNPARVVDSPRARLLIERARNQHGWVLIDAAPTDTFSDAHRLARWADATVLVARSGKTEYEKLRATAEQFRRLGGLCPGVVLNGAASAAADHFRKSGGHDAAPPSPPTPTARNRHEAAIDNREENR